LDPAESTVHNRKERRDREIEDTAAIPNGGTTYSKTKFVDRKRNDSTGRKDHGEDHATVNPCYNHRESDCDHEEAEYDDNKENRDYFETGESYSEFRKEFGNFIEHNFEGDSHHNNKHFDDERWNGYVDCSHDEKESTAANYF